MSLATIQSAFAEAIYGNYNENEQQPLQALIDSSLAFTADERVAVYRNNTLGTLRDVLQTTFPVCVSLVGEAYFRQLANYHVQQNPSDNRNLDLYGKTFSQTLADLLTQRPELKALAYLPDIAQLEWYLHESYYAPDRAVFDVEAFASLTPEEQYCVRFELAPDLCLLPSEYPIFSLWQQHQEQEQTESIHIRLENNAESVLVVRDAFKPQPMLITAAFYRLLAGLQAGQSLIALSEYLAESPVDLGTLIQRQWIVGFHHDER